MLSTLTQQGDRGLRAALQTNDPSRFEGGEEALLRCVQELVMCIRMSERDTLARLICRCVSYRTRRREKSRTYISEHPPVRGGGRGGECYVLLYIVIMKKV